MTESEPGFVDTNVFVYAFSTQNLNKQVVAGDLLAVLMERGNLRTSTQVLQEMYVVLMRKSRSPASAPTALALIETVSKWPVVTIDPAMVLSAAELSVGSVISFWDALIVVSASRVGATRLYTENLSHGQKIMGVEIVNPFLACV